MPKWGHLAQEAPRPVSSNLLKRSVKKMMGSGGGAQMGASNPGNHREPKGAHRPAKRDPETPRGAPEGAHKRPKASSWASKATPGAPRTPP